MNPLNHKAARKAIHRIKAVHKQLLSIERMLPTKRHAGAGKKFGAHRARRR